MDEHFALGVADALAKEAGLSFIIPAVVGYKRGHGAKHATAVNVSTGAALAALLNPRLVAKRTGSIFRRTRVARKLSPLATVLGGMLGYGGGELGGLAAKGIGRIAR